MARRDIQKELQALYMVRQLPAEERVCILRKALSDRVNVIVGRAALLSAECAVGQLVPELVAAFERLFRDPVKTDPQCLGKNALAKALKELGHAEGATFLRGTGYIQMEPVWGGSTDAAGTLRGTCALALVQCSDLTREEVFRHLVDACTDVVPTVRGDAIRGLLQMGGDGGALLLRLKARAGDEDAQITGQAIEAVLQLEGESAVAWAARFLDAGEVVSDEAALALGASRLPSAVGILIDRWTNTKAPSAAILRGLALSRLPAAGDFLLKVAESARTKDAVVALESLAVLASSPDVCARVAAVLETRSDEQLTRAWQSATAASKG